MKLISKSKYIGDMTFPSFKSRQHYMVTTKGWCIIFPNSIKEYEQSVQELCDKLRYRGIIHVTVDEKELKVGDTQRKPELHVDGRFDGQGSSWNHYCNELPLPRMSVAVASNVARCKVYNGEFDGVPSEQGDLSHIRDQVGEGTLVPSNEWHLLSPDCVHESLPMDKDCKRSFIRVAFEGVVV